MKCGLLGRKLGHSYSPQIHSQFGSYSYDLFELEPEKLGEFLRNADFSGLNVTMPYKKAVIPFLDTLSAQAQKLGAVNTIVKRDNKLIGHNTDYFGFCSMVQKSGLSPIGKKCLVLGSGGASNTACVALEELGAEVKVISRSGESNYDNLHLHSDAAIIVNATPVGMYPNCGVSPVDLTQFNKLEGVLDLVYNPARTQLLLDAEKLQIVAMNGLWMLVAQAKQAAELFTDSVIRDERIEAVYQILHKQMENIILIGMPGCGKSTVGKQVTALCGKQFVDADGQIEKVAGKSIPAIFKDDGEEAFRALETQVLAELGKRSGLLIATGGGCVTQERNLPLLRQNGRIFYLKRDIEKLPTAGRPISQAKPLEELYRQRKARYEAFADRIIDNNGAVEAAAAVIAGEYL